MERTSQIFLAAVCIMIIATFGATADRTWTSVDNVTREVIEGVWAGHEFGEKKYIGSEPVLWPFGDDMKVTMVGGTTLEVSDGISGVGQPPQDLSSEKKPVVNIGGTRIYRDAPLPSEELPYPLVFFKRNGKFFMKNNGASPYELVLGGGQEFEFEFKLEPT